MKKFLFLTLFTFLVGLFVFPSFQPTFAASCPGGGSGTLDGGGCTFDSNCCSKSCVAQAGSRVRICAPAGGSVATSCTCDQNQQKLPGQNGFLCNYPGDPPKRHGWCNSPDQTCINSADSTYAFVSVNNEKWELPKGVQAKGIDCTSATITYPIPSPPCQMPYDSFGRCQSITTAFGTFFTNPAQFILQVFGILLAASGAIGLILIMRAGYRIMTSRGNPEGIKEGREQITAAIVGLLFLIFSLVFLQVIGGDLLKIPGFTNTRSGGGSNSCTTAGGSCVSSSSCEGSNIGRAGCENGDTICCIPPSGGSTACTDAGGACVPSGACGPGDTNLGRLGCGSNVCCK